jgi:hypothetical protein
MYSHVIAICPALFLHRVQSVFSCIPPRGPSASRNRAGVPFLGAAVPRLSLRLGALPGYRISSSLAVPKEKKRTAFSACWAWCTKNMVPIAKREVPARVSFAARDMLSAASQGFVVENTPILRLNFSSTYC